MHLLVVAKSPVAGKVKTRLVPPLTFEEAAEVAEASLAQTLEAVAACAAERKLLALDGEPGGFIPPGFAVFPQRHGPFDERLAGAWADAAGPGLQIGMDTPQVTTELLDECLSRLESGPCSAVLGPADDGGWWALGLRDQWWQDVFTGVPMSTPDTCAHQEARLLAAGHRVDRLDRLRDVDTASDALAVAEQTPGSLFASTWFRAMAR